MRRWVAEVARASIGTFSGAIQSPTIGAIFGRDDVRAALVVGEVTALATGGCGSPASWRGHARADMTDQESDFDRQAVDATLDAFTGG